uniref:uncharacterized protein LOC106999362 isoform X2 n=1 Tax=Macaca mulatta TaxID=9544 RepID=UPI0010A227C5|nr:uncharacterized protein LOC106999362 isoform X2 [Macaca mulatta]
MLDYALIGALSAAVVAEPAPVRGGCISAPLRRLLAPLSRPARGIAGLSMRAALPSRNCRKKGNLFMFKKRKVRNKKERNCPSSWQQKVRMERLPSFTSYFFFLASSSPHCPHVFHLFQVLVMHFAASLQFSSMEGERKQCATSDKPFGLLTPTRCLLY